jgi:hypothetical protein
LEREWIFVSVLTVMEAVLNKLQYPDR